MNCFKCLFGFANSFVRLSDWRDFALVKFCLCALGVIVGTTLPRRMKKPALIAASIIFVATYVPLMYKFIKLILRKAPVTK